MDVDSRHRQTLEALSGAGHGCAPFKRPAAADARA
jgi:hypothetical protein